MNFDRIDMALDALRRLDRSSFSSVELFTGLDGQRNVTLREQVLNDSLMEALVRNEPEFVKAYLENGASVAGLRPSKEFNEKITKQKSELTDSKRARNIREMLDTLPLMATAVEELYERAAVQGLSHVLEMVQHSKYRGKNKGLDYSMGGTRRYNVLHMERLMQDLVGGDFRIARKWQTFSSLTKIQQTLIANHVLLVGCASLWCG